MSKRITIGRAMKMEKIIYAMNAASEHENEEYAQFDESLRAVIDERYKLSFDRSRLTSASEIHREAKRLIGIEF
ncbi:MAG: hypothetical protein LBR44_09030 [Clostridiales Family XIII bacterium]|nr:hypothetical protein [Clostridiales Family XIII bacterium]